MRLGAEVASLLLVVACQTPPEDRCAAKVDESTLDIDCRPPEGAEWGDRVLDEAREGFEERSPRGRR